MGIPHETWQETAVRIAAYRETLPTIFPELFEGMDEYRLKITDNFGDDRKHKFEFINGMHDDDLPSYRYEINLDKSSFKLIHNFNCLVIASDYHEMVAKRNQAIAGEIQFIRLPEFQCKFQIGKHGIDFWANGAGGFISGAHTPDKTFDGCTRFATRYLTDSYGNYTWPRSFECGYIEREYRVEQSQLKKALSYAKKRKNARIKKERDESPEFQIFIEETIDSLFSFKYSWPGVTGEVQLATSAPEEEIHAVFANIFKMYFEKG